MSMSNIIPSPKSYQNSQSRLNNLQQHQIQQQRSRENGLGINPYLTGGAESHAFSPSNKTIGQPSFSMNRAAIETSAFNPPPGLRIHTSDSLTNISGVYPPPQPPRITPNSSSSQFQTDSSFRGGNLWNISNLNSIESSQINSQRSAELGGQVFQGSNNFQMKEAVLSSKSNAIDYSLFSGLQSNSSTVSIIRFLLAFILCNYYICK